MLFIGQLCLILVTTTLVSHGAKRIGIPAVVGQLLTGIFLGTGGLQLLQSSEMIHEFSELGVILLMFLAGVESDLALLRRYAKPAFLVAVLGVILPIILGATGTFLFGFSLKVALFSGMILAATSVSISVEVLKELKALQTKEGATILGASVVDDLLVVVLFSLSLPYFQEGHSTATPLALLFGEQALYFGFIFFTIRWLAPRLIALSQKLFVTGSVVIASLVLCLGMAFLADLVGLSSVIGAFFAGIAIGQTSAKDQVFKNVEIVGYSLFIPVFFVSIGLSISFQQLLDQGGLIFVLLAVAFASKLLGGFMGSRLAGFSAHGAWMIGSGMVSRGEMALIILQLGDQVQIVPHILFGPMVIVIIVSTLLSPFLLKYFTKKVYPA
ncbi:cation:proton antiporter [Enterococcus camelliae]|uniref:Cation:proton antiporter n=1 Tax=Enterococcus camelliae TaxID=453959 RepID=A0ABW5TH11_9ENTE